MAQSDKLHNIIHKLDAETGQKKLQKYLLVFTSFVSVFLQHIVERGVAESRAADGCVTMCVCFGVCVCGWVEVER